MYDSRYVFIVRAFYLGYINLIIISLAIPLSKHVNDKTILDWQVWLRIQCLLVQHFHQKRKTWMITKMKKQKDVNSVLRIHVWFMIRVYNKKMQPSSSRVDFVLIWQQLNLFVYCKSGINSSFLYWFIWVF